MGATCPQQIPPCLTVRIFSRMLQLPASIQRVLRMVRSMCRVVVDAGAGPRAQAHLKARRAAHRPATAARRVPKQRAQARSGGGLRKRPRRADMIEPAMLLQGPATPLGSPPGNRSISGPAGSQLASGHTHRRQGGSHQSGWWFPWRIFALSRDGPHWQYCRPPQEQIFSLETDRAKVRDKQASIVMPLNGGWLPS